jgi:hypothetical protein
MYTWASLEKKERTELKDHIRCMMRSKKTFNWHEVVKLYRGIKLAKEKKILSSQELVPVVLATAGSCGGNPISLILAYEKRKAFFKRQNNLIVHEIF